MGTKKGRAEYYVILFRAIDFRPLFSPRERDANRSQRRSCTAERTSGAPFGAEEWVNKTAERLGLATTLRPRGRPKMPLKKGS